MTCAKYRLLIQDYADGELDHTSCREMESHLQGCALCQERLDQVRCIKGLLQRKFCPQPAPVDLARRISQKIHKADSRKYITHRLAAILTAVVLVCAGAMIAMSWFDSDKPGKDSRIPHAFTVALVDDHIHSLAKETPWQLKTNDREDMEQWFTDKLDIAVRLPPFAGSDVELEGGRLCHVLDIRVALMFYQMRGQRLSLFVMNDAGIYERASHADGCVQNHYKGYTVLYWQKHGLLYAIVARDEVERLAKIIANEVKGEKS